MKNPVRDLTEKNREYRADAILGIERLSDIVRSLKGASYDDWPKKYSNSAMRGGSENSLPITINSIYRHAFGSSIWAHENNGFRLARTKK